MGFFEFEIIRLFLDAECRCVLDSDAVPYSQRAPFIQYQLPISNFKILWKNFFLNIFLSILGTQMPAIPTPEQFVNKHGGKRVINKILIANNGIAGRFIKSFFIFIKNFFLENSFIIF